MSDSVVISAHAGGLGDNLCHSTLPELYARAGLKVLIGRPVHEPGMRNPEARRLVWELNPFVSGFVDEVGINFSTQEMLKWIWQQPERRTLVEALEALHGFQPVHQIPKVYYQPKWRPDLRETIFTDPSSISRPIPPKVFDSFVDHVCRWRGVDRRSIVLLGSKYSTARHFEALSGNDRYKVADIFEYCDIIASCRLFITADSGGAILASALRGADAMPEVVSLFTTLSFNDRLFQFPNVKYCVTGKATDDDFFVFT